MSEYLGWTERRAPAGSRSTYREDHLPGGPVTHSYESYVKNIFHPSNRLKRDKDQFATDHGVSASSMLRMERTLGKHALESNIDEENPFLTTPLERMYSELGLKNQDTKLYTPYQVYVPKSSSEYHAIRHGNVERDNTPYQRGGHYTSYRERADEEYERNNRKSLIDYKDFDSRASNRYAYDGYMFSPLSPYLYQSHPYMRDQDTRIVGSNFVQVTTRPKDRFLEKIDQTLAEVRAMPRYT